MTKTSNRTLTPTERHEFVAFGVTSGKSNRTIAKELGVDEGTNLARPKIPRDARE